MSDQEEIEDVHQNATWNSIDTATKISKICHVDELPGNVDAYLTGSWDAQQNSLKLWNVYYGRAKVSSESYFKACNEIPVPASVNDICCQGEVAVCGLENGSVEICSVIDGENIRKLYTRSKVHGKSGSSNSVCIIDGEVFSGGDNDDIVRFDLANTANPSLLSSDLNSVKCMTNCGSHEFVSGHSSGQIHLWDVRQPNPAITMLGEAPVFSKAAAPLTDSVTSLDSHPAQPNVIAYGTFSGSLAFIDVRHSKQFTPNLLKVGKYPISSVAFHPVFPNNCFALASDSFLHFDVSQGKALNLEPESSSDDGKSRVNNVWLTAASLNTLQINALLVDSPRQLSSFGISSHSILCGSNKNTISLLTNTRFY